MFDITKDCQKTGFYVIGEVNGDDTVIHEETGMDAETCEDIYPFIWAWWNETEDYNKEHNLDPLDSEDIWVYVHIEKRVNETERMDSFL